MSAGNFKQHEEKQRKASGSECANTIGVEAGMFLRSRLQGIEVNLLVDTGATLTLVSSAIAQRIAHDRVPALELMQKNVVDAGGKMLNVSGKGMFVLEIDNFSCNVTAAVAELTVDGIIGLD